MDYKQLKSPNLSVVGHSGWCLAYVTEVFGVAGKYPAAINAWEGASYKHTGSPPANVSVPVWFSYNGPYGHVAVWVPGQGVYSTSALGDRVFPSVSALVSWMGEGFKYLGWSEDINGVRVVDQVPQEAPGNPPANVNTYELHVAVNGYVHATDAASHSGNAVNVPAGVYAVFNQADGMVNVTRVAGSPGSWINPADNQQPVSVQPAVVPSSAPVGDPSYDGDSITIQKGWGLSQAAEAAGWPDAGQPARWQAIAVLNGSDNWQAFNESLRSGQRIKVGKYEAPAPAPVQAPSQSPANTEYALWTGQTWFSTNKNPTHVWMLDFVNDAHATSAVDYPVDKSVEIYGKAQRTDGDRPVYLMTKEDFGDADKTGTPNSNRGINIVDLTPAQAPDTSAPVADPTPNTAAAAQTDSVAEKIPVNVIHWQDSINTAGYPVKDQLTDNVLVSDLEGKITERHQLVKGQPVTIAGDATVNGIKYGFTPTSLANKTYFGIPLDKLQKLNVLSEEDAVLAGILSDIEKEIEDEAKKLSSKIKPAEVNNLVSRLIKRK